MRTVISVACLSCCLLLVAVGCNKGDPGGKDVVKDKDKVGDNNFSLDVPNTATKLKQGETKVVSISIKKGKNFADEVKLTFSDVPSGVTIEPVTVAKNESEGKVTVKAAEDAKVGDYTVKVHGEPGKGEKAKNELNISVQAK